MNFNIEQVKLIQIKAVENMIGFDVIKAMVDVIRNAANKGRESVQLNYKDYNIDNKNLPTVAYWLRLCGFGVSFYNTELMVIKW